MLSEVSRFKSLTTSGPQSSILDHSRQELRRLLLYQERIRFLLAFLLPWYRLFLTHLHREYVSGNLYHSAYSAYTS